MLLTEIICIECTYLNDCIEFETSNDKVRTKQRRWQTCNGDVHARARASSNGIMSGDKYSSCVHYDCSRVIG